MPDAKVEKLLKQLKETDQLEDWLYLIHHLHPDDETEEVHHCPMIDHLGNLYKVEHMEIDGKAVHVITGLIEEQDVFWSDEEARAAGEGVPCANRQLG